MGGMLCLHVGIWDYCCMATQPKAGQTSTMHDEPCRPLSDTQNMRKGMHMSCSQAAQRVLSVVCFANLTSTRMRLTWCGILWGDRPSWEAAAAGRKYSSCLRENQVRRCWARTHITKQIAWMIELHSTSQQSRKLPAYQQKRLERLWVLVYQPWLINLDQWWPTCLRKN